MVGRQAGEQEVRKGSRMDSAADIVDNQMPRAVVAVRTSTAGCRNMDTVEQSAAVVSVPCASFPCQ